MEVKVAENCGFCPGVKNAINLAEKTLGEREKVYSLGPIIHNKDVVERLARKGLRTVYKPEDIPGGTVLIRSHGIGPGDLRKLRDRGLEIVDATCVLVKKVQEIAKRLSEDGYQVIIIGDRNHPEVQAVVGCAADVIVLSELGDLEKVAKEGKLGVVCQTTQSLEHLSEMLCAIGRRGFLELRSINTLCREAIKRQESAVALCREVEVMFVLGGLESANTRKLAELCKRYNRETFHLQNWGECDRRVFSGKSNAGVTAGASTPDWIIREFVEKVRDV